jgi:uracil-DNA glycosylase
MPTRRKISQRAMLDRLLRSGKLNAGQAIAFRKLHATLASGDVTTLSERDGLWVEHVYYEHKAGKASETTAKAGDGAAIAPSVRGWWRITKTEMWTADALDIQGPAMISFTGDDDRRRMIAILAHVNVKPTKTGVSFTWEGADEFDPISGTGTAKLGKDGRLSGKIKIKNGDSSTSWPSVPKSPRSRSPIRQATGTSGAEGSGSERSMNVTGTFPFGSELRALTQQDRRQKKAFVLGVYASAVHARWIGPDGRELVRALAVASEPQIFWDGSHVTDIVAIIRVPAEAGRLEQADSKFNGPSGRSLDADFLVPLKLTRSDAWLCDLVPHTCLNPSQRAAIERAYEPRREAFKLSPVDLPPVPNAFADPTRRQEILAEIEEADPEVIVLLGDKPMEHFLRHFDRRWHRLSDFEQGGYGRVHEVKIAGRVRGMLPLAHPRQVAALGQHSPVWRQRHEQWKRERAPTLL